MARSTWIIIYGLFFNTAADLTISKHDGKDRTVNLALETVLEFNNKDNADINFLNNVQRFIGKVKNVIEKKNGGRRDFNYSKHKRFTEFIHNAIIILSKYEDTDLENFISALNSEMRKYHYKGCKFYELTENHGFRLFFAKKLDTIKNKPANFIRNVIKSIADKIEADDFEEHEKELIDTVNSIYRQDDVDNFKTFLNNIDDYRLKTRKNVDLVKIVSEGIKPIIFDHYTQLNNNARIALKSKVDEFFDYFMSNSTVNEVSTPKLRKKETTKDRTTIRQMYVEKNLDLKYDPYAYDHLRPKTRSKAKPRSDTNAGSSEHRKDNVLRSYKINPDKKFKYKKISKKFDVDSDSRSIVKTTKEHRTLRQMYVENDHDSKYDKRVHDRLVAGPKVKTKKQTPIILRQNSLTTRKAEEKSIKFGSNLNKNKIGKFRYIQKRITDNDSESDSFEYQTKPTKNLRTVRQMYVEKNLDLKYDPYAYDHVNPEVRGKEKKITFMSLYPVAMDKPTPKLRAVKRKTSSDAPIHRAKASNQDTGLKIYTYAPGKPKMLKLVKKLDYSTDYKRDLNPPRRMQKTENLEYLREESEEENLRRSKDRLKKAIRRLAVGLTTPRQRKPMILNQLKMSRDPPILARRFAVAPGAKQDYRRSFVKDAEMSEEGMSIEDFANINHKGPFRRSNGNVTTAVTVDTNVLTRIQKLENDLQVVKTQMNDSKVDAEVVKNEDVPKQFYNGESVTKKPNAVKVLDSKEMLEDDTFKMKVTKVDNDKKNPVKADEFSDSNEHDFYAPGKSTLKFATKNASINDTVKKEKEFDTFDIKRRQVINSEGNTLTYKNSDNFKFEKAREKIQNSIPDVTEKDTNTKYYFRANKDDDSSIRIYAELHNPNKELDNNKTHESIDDKNESHKEIIKKKTYNIEEDIPKKEGDNDNIIKSVSDRDEFNKNILNSSVYESIEQNEDHARLLKNESNRDVFNLRRLTNDSDGELLRIDIDDYMPKTAVSNTKLNKTKDVKTETIVFRSHIENTTPIEVIDDTINIEVTETVSDATKTSVTATKEAVIESQAAFNNATENTKEIAIDKINKMDKFNVAKVRVEKDEIKEDVSIVTTLPSINTKSSLSYQNMVDLNREILNKTAIEIQHV